MDEVKMHRAPMLRGKGLDKEIAAMELPAGKTCADCRHCARCCAMFGPVPRLVDIGTGDAWA